MTPTYSSGLARACNGRHRAAPVAAYCPYGSSNSGSGRAERCDPRGATPWPRSVRDHHREAVVPGRVEDRALVHAAVALVVGHTDGDGGLALTSHTIVGREADVVDAPVARERWAAAALGPHGGDARAQPESVGLGSPISLVVDRLVLVDETNGDRHGIAIHFPLKRAIKA